MSVLAVTAYQYRRFFKTIIYLLFFSFSLYTFGCYTTREVAYDKKEIDEINQYTVLKIITNKGETINVRGFNVNYLRKYNEITNAVVYSKNLPDTTWLNNNGKKEYKLKSVENAIPLSDISMIFVEKTEIKTGRIILIALGVIVVCIALAAVFTTKKAVDETVKHVY